MLLQDEHDDAEDEDHADSNHVDSDTPSPARGRTVGTFVDRKFPSRLHQSASGKS